MGVQLPIPIQLDKLRHLKFDLKALAFAEQELAKHWGVKRVSFFQHFKNPEDMGAADLVILLLAGLRHEDPALTLDDAYRLLSAGNMMDTFQQLNAALNQHVNNGKTAETPAAAGDAPADPPQPTTAAIPSSSTGPNSGASGGSTST